VSTATDVDLGLIVTDETYQEPRCGRRMRACPNVATVLVVWARPCSCIPQQPLCTPCHDDLHEMSRLGTGAMFARCNDHGHWCVEVEHRPIGSSS
jgi:hypothetical protein